MPPLKLREQEGGVVIAQGSAWKDPRIFFAGYGPQASTIGANRAGRFIARQAIASLSKLKREQREQVEREEYAAQTGAIDEGRVVKQGNTRAVVTSFDDLIGDEPY